MQENNMSVFGTVIRNEEIADFMRLLNLAREIFKQELTVVEIMPGGLTNKNFRAVTEDGTQIAIRLAGQGTANYINRPGEKHNAGEIAGLGIAPEIYYYDPKTGSQIVEYIDAPTMHPVDFQTRDEVLVKAGAVMRRYHDSGLEFKTSFDPVAKIDEYKAILDEHSYGKRYEGWERMVEALERIRAAYATGRGKITLRGRATIEETKNGRTQIIITEIPYMVNKARLIENMAELVKDKRIEGITGLNDETNRKGMRIVVDIRKDANAQVILNQLYQYTQLQDTVGVIMLAIDHKVPKVMTLKQMIQKYVEFQDEVVRRRTQYDLKKAKERAHILEGLKKATDIVDELIATIRACKGGMAEAKAAIMEQFGFDDPQADAIVKLQLGRLAGLEILKIEEELSGLQAKIKDWEDILANDARVLEIVKNELLDMKKRFGDERRTEIQSVTGEVDIEDLIAEEQCVYTLTEAGYIKRQLKATYQAQKRGGRGISGMTRKEEDIVQEMFVGSTHDYVLFVTDKGRLFRIKGYTIAEGSRTSKGSNIVNLLQLAEGEKVTNMLCYPKDEDNKGGFVTMVTKQGLIKRTPLEQYANIRKTGLIGIALNEGDALAWTRLTTGNDMLIVATRNGQAIRFNEADARPMGRSGHGVRAIKLAEGDEVVGVCICREGGTVLTVTENGKGRRSDIDTYRITARGGKGIRNYDASKDKVAAVKIVDDIDDVLLSSQEGIIIRLHANEIPVQSRYGSGVRVMRLGENDKVMVLARTDHDDEAQTESIEADTEDEPTAEQLAEMEAADEASAAEAPEADTGDEE